jgi:hypothetical protein
MVIQMNGQMDVKIALVIRNSKCCLDETRRRFANTWRMRAPDTDVNRSTLPADGRGPIGQKGETARTAPDTAIAKRTAFQQSGRRRPGAKGRSWGMSSKLRAAA